MNIEECVDRLKKAWSKDSAQPGFAKNWTEENPSFGQYDVTALYVHENLGGEIMLCKINGEKRYVNSIDGKTMDFTEENLGEGMKYKMISMQDSIKMLRNKDISARYFKLKSRTVPRMF